MAPVLGYWDARGRAEPIRILLTYAGVKFEDKRYARSEEGKAEWNKDKFSLGLDFPNLPYYLDSDVKITQTLAILRLIARKHKLEGSTDAEQNKVAVLEQQVLDYFTAFITFVHKQGSTEEEKAAFLTELAGQLEALSKFLGANNFAVGSQFTYVDAWFYEYIHHLETTEITKASVSKYANLTSYLKRRAGPIRLLLKYVGANYVDRLYEYGTASGKADWASDKEKLASEMDFPNLPYLIDGNVKISQASCLFEITLAILRYLARKYKLNGDTEEAKTRIDVLEQQLSDNAVLVWTFLFKQGATEEDKATFLASLKKNLDGFSKFLGNKPYVTGDSLTVGDIFLYENIRFINAQEFFKGEVSKNWSNLGAFLKNIESLPQVSDYLKEANAKPGVDFVDKRYSKGADGKGQEWLDEKFTLGLDFPNIPYLIDPANNVKITQSLAILRYLARKYKLEGETEEQKNRAAVLEQQVYDLNMNFFRTIFSPDFEKNKAEYLKTLPDQLKAVSNFIGSNQYSTGNSVTYVDFWLYELLVKLKVFSPDIFNQFNVLVSFVDRLESNKNIAAWRKKKGPQKFVGFGPFQVEY
ncbi:Glutathione S-transferase Mu 3 [Tyrophagus putrescentiae]|nr:Glutathione S-transferase Mu 3 [Tyrophagus putrescentiae]KAH9394171.1 Glutathione S-transferase Mu 3 [Tyrophagus putrescentiae]